MLCTNDDPILSEICIAVPEPIVPEDIMAITKAMFKLMYDNRGIGLAAPQVGIRSRIIVVDVQGFRMAMINPVIVRSSPQHTMAAEKCLSFPGLQVSVSRPKQITVAYTRPSGTYAIQKLRGLAARCVLHEIDHLNGITLRTHQNQEGPSDG